jgi:hypothetical protein
MQKDVIISREMLVSAEAKGRTGYQRYLYKRRMERRSPKRLEGPKIAKRTEREERITVERSAISVMSGSGSQN